MYGWKHVYFALSSALRRWRWQRFVFILSVLSGLLGTFWIKMPLCWFVFAC